MFAAQLPGPYFPLSTLQPIPCGMRRMTRGQRGSLLLHCVTLSFTTLCRSPGAFGYFHAPLAGLTHQSEAKRSIFPSSEVSGQNSKAGRQYGSLTTFGISKRADSDFVDRIRRPLATQCLEDAAGCGEFDFQSRAIDRSAQVWRQQRAIGVSYQAGIDPFRMVRSRRISHFETPAGVSAKTPLFPSPRSCLFIDNRPAADVDQISSRLHLRQGFVIDEVQTRGIER